MLKKIAFTMIPVKDMIRARRFYEETLGLKLSSDFGGTWVEYDLPEGGCIALTNMATGVNPSSTAGMSVGFEVEDVVALCSKLKKLGVIEKLPLFETPVCKMAVFLDSEGNAFTVHQCH